MIHTCGGWFWSQVCMKGTCTTPRECTKRVLWNFKEWEGKKYAGITFDWDYEKRRVHVSMPGYVDHSLICFKHGTPRRAQDQPYQHIVPTYGARQHFSIDSDGTAVIDKNSKKFVQQFTGTFLYYAIAVDSTMLMSLSTIASEKSSPTENTMKKSCYFSLRGIIGGGGRDLPCKRHGTSMP